MLTLHPRGRFSTKSFKASAAFGSDADNDAVYSGMQVAQAVQQCLDFNTRELSILAYGQTGTGKTYSTTALEGRSTTPARSIPAL